MAPLPIGFALIVAELAGQYLQSFICERPRLVQHLSASQPG
jgi:hypothetical protein